MQIPGKPFFRSLVVKKIFYLALLFLVRAEMSQAQSLGISVSRNYGNLNCVSYTNLNDANYFEARAGKGFEFGLAGSYSFQPWDREWNYRWVLGLELNSSYQYYSIVQTGYNTANQFDLKPKPSSIHTDFTQAGMNLTPSFGIKFNTDKQWSLLLGANFIYRLTANNFSSYRRYNPDSEIYTQVNVLGASNFSITPQLFGMFDYRINKHHSILLGFEVALKSRPIHFIQLVQHVYEEDYFYEAHTSMYSMTALTFGYRYNFTRNEK